MGPCLWTPLQEEARASFRAFAEEHLGPHADRFDREERLDAGIPALLAERGYLGGLVPAEFGGSPMDPVTFGFLNQEVGAACSSVRSLLTVHGMVCQAVTAWGTPAQKERWLPDLASGRALGAFALTEPEVGSDARQVQTTARPDGQGWVLDGHKKWITFGQIADLVLVLARHGEQTLALLVEGDREGVERTPLRGMLGTRASGLAEIRFQECRLPSGHLLARPGFGFPVVSSALDLGRFSVAWGCVGLGQACLEASLAYTSSRRQFGRPLAGHQLVQGMVADMLVGVRASRLLCLQAAASRAVGHPGSVLDTLVAKYHASTMAMQAARDAVQLHGANGCSADYPVSRYLRDAKTMEIIEGTSQILQGLIAGQARQDVPPSGATG